MDALTFIKLMDNGINLGNTMEAAGSRLGYYQKDASVYETAWGKPKTIKAMFVAMKEAGFDSVRIPIAWTHTMDWANGDSEINQNYMKRVAQVVDWALEADLYVMINDHWDYQWWGLFSHDQELKLIITLKGRQTFWIIAINTITVHSFRTATLSLRRLARWALLILI